MAWMAFGPQPPININPQHFTRPSVFLYYRHNDLSYLLTIHLFGSQVPYTRVIALKL